MSSGDALVVGRCGVVCGGGDAACGWVARRGGVGSAVIVVGEPLAQRVSSLLLADEWAGVEELLSQDSVVAFDFAVVPRRVGLRALVAAHEVADRVVESGGAVGRPVVGDQARNALDPVGLEEGAGTDFPLTRIEEGRPGAGKDKVRRPHPASASSAHAWIRSSLTRSP